MLLTILKAAELVFNFHFQIILNLKPIIVIFIINVTQAHGVDDLFGLLSRFQEVF